MRLDVMSVMRGVAAFRGTLGTSGHGGGGLGDAHDLSSLPDLVQAKKTQRDKDWPMLRRLLEADLIQHQAAPTPARIRFWFGECRSAQPLIALAQGHPELAAQAASSRPLLSFAIGETRARWPRPWRAKSNANAPPIVTIGLPSRPNWNSSAIVRGREPSPVRPVSGWRAVRAGHGLDPEFATRSAENLPGEGPNAVRGRSGGEGEVGGQGRPLPPRPFVHQAFPAILRLVVRHLPVPTVANTCGET